MLTKTKWALLGCLIILLIFTGISLFIPEHLINGINWLAGKKELQEEEIAKKYTLIEMSFENVKIREEDFLAMVILKEKEGERHLPIFVGLPEATAIGMAAKGISLPRPLTHDLICSVIEASEGKVDFIVIDDIRNNTFYAKIFIKIGKKKLEIDSRPSDAIAIALRMKAPIYAEKKVLDRTGISLKIEMSSFSLKGWSFQPFIFWKIE